MPDRGRLRRWTATLLDRVGLWCFDTSSRLDPLEIPDAVLDRVTQAILAKLDAHPVRAVSSAEAATVNLVERTDQALYLVPLRGGFAAFGKIHDGHQRH